MAAWRRRDLDLHVRSSRPLESLRTVHELHAGDRLDLALSWGGANRRHRFSEQELLAATADAWRRWMRGFDYDGPEAAEATTPTRRTRLPVTATAMASPSSSARPVLPNSSLPPITITVNVAPDAPDTITNTATVGTVQDELDASNNSGVVFLRVGVPAPLLSTLAIAGFVAALLAIGAVGLRRQ